MLQPLIKLYGELLIFNWLMFCIEHILLFVWCGQAESQTDAEDGIKFMQEMIELAKQRNDESGMKLLTSLQPFVIQLFNKTLLHPSIFSLFLPRAVLKYT